MDTPAAEPDIGPSPYLAWLLSLSAEDRARYNAEAEHLARHLHALVKVLRKLQPGFPLGVWLHALRMVWQELEPQLRTKEPRT